jgi:phosphinothricin acetyltransferase
MNWKYKTKDGKKVVVRKAGEENLQEITNIWNAMVDEKDYTMGRDKFTLEQEKKYFNSLGKREAFVVAVIEGEIAGYSHLNIHHKQSLSTNHVAYIGTWIKRGFRETGVGTALLKSTLDFAKKNNFEKACTEVRSSNKRGLAFYKKAGFYEVGRYKKHIKIEEKYDDWVIIEKLFDSEEVQ